MKYVVYIFLALALLVAVACGSDPEQQACKDIPPGGCPLSYGVACQDPSCAAVYACNSDGTWALDHQCPGGGVDAGQDVVVEAAPEVSTGSVYDANFDAPPGSNGGPGCPTLEEPDCALGDVLACPSGCCNCEDLFVCQGGGWNHWGTCDASGLHQDK